MDAYHTLVVKMCEEEVNFLLKGKKERQPTKKRVIVFGGSISKKIYQRFLQKRRCATKRIFKW